VQEKGYYLALTNPLRSDAVSPELTVMQRHSGVVSTAPVQASSDEQLLSLWLNGRSRHTRRAYETDARAFLAHAGVSLRQVMVGHVQGYGASLEHLSSATRARRLSAVKSLLSFGHRLGYLPFDVGSVVKLPSIKNTLAERILTEAQVHRMIGTERSDRNRVLLTVIYAAGLRVSEVSGLRWRDVQERGDAGQLTVFGKGGKTRAVLLPESVWSELVTLRPENTDRDAPVFRSREGGALDPAQVHRIVRAAAKRARLKSAVSAHWLRHAHASHALDRGAPPHLVQSTLGHASLSTTSRYLHARPNDSSARYLSI
jgi:integrase/recombinase XerD